MKTIFLKVTSAFMLAGQIAKANDVVGVDETNAKDLLHRGKAVLADGDQLDDGPKTISTGSAEADEDSDQSQSETETGQKASNHAASESADAQPKAKGKGKK